MNILETERVFLREFAPGDADALARVISDKEPMRYYPGPYDRAGVEEWIARNRRRYASDGHGLWAMCLRETGELIGDCGLCRQLVAGIEEVELGYHLRRDLWGRGYAHEAARACRNWGFAHLDLDYLISLIRAVNLPSRRVAEKNGFTLWKEVQWRDLPHLVYRIRRQEISR